ncbi:MAG: hypothetical protein ACRC62_25780 [Microcoleus sp.]
MSILIDNNRLSTKILCNCIHCVGAGVKHSDTKLAIYFRDYRPNASPLQVSSIDAIAQNRTTVNCQLSTVNCQLSTFNSLFSVLM